jgi:hypothetical protein
MEWGVIGKQDAAEKILEGENNMAREKGNMFFRQL